MPTVTRELMERGRREGGAWNERQLKTFNTTAVNNKGWYRRLLGTVVTQEQVDQFLALRNPKPLVKKINPRPMESTLFAHPFTKALERDEVTEEYDEMFSGVQDEDDDGKAPWED